MRQPPTTLDFTVNILFTSFNFTSPFMLWLLNPRMRRLTDLTLYQMVSFDIFTEIFLLSACPNQIIIRVWRVALTISRNRGDRKILWSQRASISFLFCFQSSCWPKVACCSGGVVHREGNWLWSNFYIQSIFLLQRWKIITISRKNWVFNHTENHDQSHFRVLERWEEEERILAKRHQWRMNLFYRKLLNYLLSIRCL